MLNNIKWLIVVALLVGSALFSLGDYAKAQGANECVQYCKDRCYVLWHDDCVEACSYLPKKDRGKCIAQCNLEASCQFNYCLWDECYLGSEVLPPFCE